MTVSPLDTLIDRSLRAFASDSLGCGWRGKEHDWVNRYTFGYLLKECQPDSPLYDPAQLAVEVGVAQPPGYAKAAANRDIVIWDRPGMSCWSEDWQPVHHPLAILEWKVHRPNRLNRDQKHERQWLREYSAWQARPICYAVEVRWSPSQASLKCTRFAAGVETVDWIDVRSPRAGAHHG
jgi:hypothetical protein